MYHTQSDITSEPNETAGQTIHSYILFFALSPYTPIGSAVILFLVNRQTKTHWFSMMTRSHQRFSKTLCITILRFISISNTLLIYQFLSLDLDIIANVIELKTLPAYYMLMLTSQSTNGYTINWNLFINQFWNEWIELIIIHSSQWTTFHFLRNKVINFRARQNEWKFHEFVIANWK